MLVTGRRHGHVHPTFALQDFPQIDGDPAVVVDTGKTGSVRLELSASTR